MNTPDYWIQNLSLTAHPEGGYFKEIYRSAETVPPAGLPSRYDGARALSTSIYFLLKSGQCSRFHRLRSDEMWHFYTGSPLTLHQLASDGAYRRLRLGPDPAAGEAFQIVIPHGAWFGATVDQPNSFTLIGCTVAPGFDFADFELATPALADQFPAHADLIRRLT